jgi:hypothetical protein
VTETTPISIVSGRSCGTCTLCCKVLAIEALEKPSDTWCKHCSIGKGCTIYDTRPGECRTFHCSYLIDATLDERWKPSESRLVIWWNEGMTRLAVSVDPQRPDAWKREPYYSVLRRLAKRAADAEQQVMIFIGPRVWIMLPDRDVDLGQIPDGNLVIVEKKLTPQGMRHEVVVVPADDPRAAAFRNSKNAPG